MTRYLFTKLQAEAFCEDFRYLVGESFEFGNGRSSRIECVAICPFDDISKYIFAIEYHKYKDPARAMEMYIGPIYDVMVIAEKGAADIFPAYISLSEYLKCKKIDYEIIGADVLETGP